MELGFFKKNYKKIIIVVFIVIGVVGSGIFVGYQFYFKGKLEYEREMPLKDKVGVDEKFIEDESIEEKVEPPHLITEVVDDYGWVGIDSNIAVDKKNIPHICHYDQANRDLKYATRVYVSWKNETVDSAGDVGEECGIAVDSSNNPHISYIDVTNRVLKYAKKVNGAWSVSTIDRAAWGFFIVSTSIALDSNGSPHIVYNQSSGDDPIGSVVNVVKLVSADNDNGDDAVDNGDDDEVDDPIDDDAGGVDVPSNYVKYASWDGSKWNIEIITTIGEDVYLALDSNNAPHVSFGRELEGSGNLRRLYYANKVTGSWKLEMVDSATYAGGDTGIALDSKNFPHIVYNDYGSAAKKYARWNGQVWETETVAENTGKGEGVKIAVDNNDKPRVIYANEITESLMLATKDGDNWISERVDNMGNPSITVDQLNRSHISYGHTPQEKDDDDDIPEMGVKEEIEILKYALVN